MLGLRPVGHVLRAQDKMEGAGVRIRRSIGTPALDYLDPFLLLDEFKSNNSSDYLAGFPDHPHRGFETVTYMVSGSMRHEDHNGNRGDIGPGSVQWMTAGRGIVHSEMPIQNDGLMWGFQLWINLPAKDKMMAPRYQDIAASKIPEVELCGGVRARVVAGKLSAIQGPVIEIVTEPLFVDLCLQASVEYIHSVPVGHNAFCYVFDGEGIVSSKSISAGELVTLPRHELTSIQFLAGGNGLRALLVAARALDEPVARGGPFVMNTREELLQAFSDYQRGKFLD